MSAEAALATLLKALTERYPPPPGTRHTLHAELLGTPVRGYRHELCLQMSARAPLEVIVLDDGDLEKPLDQLLADVDRELLKMERGRHFDHATGG